MKPLQSILKKLPLLVQITMPDDSNRLKKAEEKAFLANFEEASDTGTAIFTQRTQALSNDWRSEAVHRSSHTGT